MMGDDFVIVQGGFIKDEYSKETNLLNINCNDTYAGLPEKVMKSFHFILSDDRFSKYTHFCKVDDDMQIIKRFEDFNYDYAGNVYKHEGIRNWHIGRCGEGNHWNHTIYDGKFEPWCLGGFGYVISRNALEKVLPNFDYINHIYEDVYMGNIMKSAGINPILIDTKEYMISPDHF